MHAGLQALGRIKTGSMNKSEAAYASDLDARKVSGDVMWWAFEAIKIRLADNTFYTPDFMVMRSDSTLECHEVKGFWQDDARVKIKVAAALFPAKFIAIRAEAQKRGGGWIVEEF